MRILITGCGGFVGKHLCKKLLSHTGFWKDIQLYAGVYDEKEAESLQNAIQEQQLKLLQSGDSVLSEDHILQADITDADQVHSMVETARPDYVVHLAAQSSVALSFQNPALTMAVNVEGTSHLLEALRRVCPKARILLVGSIDQYGAVEKKGQPIPETQPLATRSPYGESKKKQEQLALDCVKTYGQDIVLVRSATHIGTGQARTFAIADWVAQVKEMKAGVRSHQLMTGNLDVVRDIADVRDIVDAYLLLLEKGKTGEVYNAGTGVGTRLSDIPHLLGELACIDDLQVVTDPARFRPADIPMLVADTKKLCACTGWSPVYSLEETLAEILSDTCIC